jgi:hypothetical protein
MPGCAAGHFKYGKYQGELKMSEDEKKSGIQKCIACECFKAIFMAIVLLAIGAIFGYGAAMRQCRLMMGPCGGPGVKACWDKSERECKDIWKFEREKGICDKGKAWFINKDDFGKCKPGCTCPKCTKISACMQEPNKPVCPMMEKKDK